ncbi:sigma-54 interaction domain-containing protein [Alicyclobacillus shizuokensis]|uniref:sigma-54 interaction domain-containing protein n=1 Tax=Alicyclobacillus shizuokensis TaxID=392014 RepID=UPI00082CF456|nr:sigma 54-interacting transcriptional regulator [Alicyclobacillus shizuokensis]MCL6625999.1 sigma 54-interacting transcriptional regulator [Alicyclobacillus shizuokensis]
MPGHDPSGGGENRAAEQRLELLEAVLDGLEEGVHVVDADGVTVYYNQKMADIEAMRPQDVLGRSIEDVFTFPDASGSTLLQAIRFRRASDNVKQTYFNNRGVAITTVNHTYPILAEDRVLGAVEIARDVTRVERLQKHILAKSGVRYTFDSIVGTSRAMADVLDQARRAARTDSSVLIVGETGTGKELFAQSLHAASRRAKGPFVSQNCAALPESLMEGLLFGTARGAFTGAINRPGLLEQADGGTLLLDELNSLSPQLQVKLLRVLQERTVRRVGELQDRAIDVRILAAINEDPLDAIRAGHLRNDLYYRLSVVTLYLPPLRERVEDIPRLVDTFIAKYNERFGLRIERLDAGLMQAFLQYTWPGNVRELEHTIEGAMNLVQEERVIGFAHLPFPMRRRLESAIQDGGGRGALEPYPATGSVPPVASAAHPAPLVGPAVQPASPVGAANESSAGGMQVAETRPVPAGGGSSLKAQMEAAQRQVFEQALVRNQGNVSATARELGLSRQNLQYWLRKLGITPGRYRG